jgi:hypothetical protein
VCQFKLYMLQEPVQDTSVIVHTVRHLQWQGHEFLVYRAYDACGTQCLHEREGSEAASEQPTITMKQQKQSATYTRQYRAER